MLYYFFFWCFCPLSFSLFPNTFQFYLQSQSNDNSLNSVKCFRKRTVMLFYYLHLIIVNKLLPLHNVVVGNWKRSTQQTDLTSFGRWQIEFNLANAFSPVSYYCLFFFFFVLFSVFFFSLPWILHASFVFNYRENRETKPKPKETNYFHYCNSILLKWNKTTNKHILCCNRTEKNKPKNFHSPKPKVKAHCFCCVLIGIVDREKIVDIATPTNIMLRSDWGKRKIRNQHFLATATKSK